MPDCWVQPDDSRLSPFIAFEKSSALAQFFRGPNADTIPVPSSEVRLWTIFRGDYEFTHYRHFCVSLNFEMVSRRTRGANGIKFQTDEFIDDEMDVFFENGLAFK